MLPLINEAVAVLRERIVEDADLVDAGVIFGAGFAPFLGGPLQYARARGIDACGSATAGAARACTAIASLRTLGGSCCA